MKVRCINNKGKADVFTLNNIYNVRYDYITIGKIYNVLEEIKKDSSSFYRLLNDDKDDSCIYEKECFKPLSEIRNEKINKLLR